MREYLRLAWAVTCVLSLASTTACLRKTEFHCTTDADCTGGGFCEATAFCSFTDTACPDGRRYGDYAGSYSNQCVGDSMIDGGVDDDSMGDGMAGCPAGYTTLATAPAHRYRVIATGASWAAQRTDCMNDGTGTYLAVPTDMTELSALVTAGNVARIWVGIDDQAQNNTFVTTNGGTFSATDPMWDTGEPDDNPVSGGGSAGCVLAQMSNAQLADDRCSNVYAAVCECEP